ncbi:MAG: hypothetical protein E7449_05950 [Ruminococcaceae bacterium]|nr:hypothetical protein [Oscillospiraceae bacterium]
MSARKLILAAAACILFALPCSAAWQVGLQDGCVALLQDGTLVQKSTTSVSLLPESDRALLRHGLYFPSLEAATHLMEDLTS